MNVKIPDGWYEIPLGQPVFVYDLQWNRKTKSWEHVTHFGDCQRRCKRRYIIRENRVRDELMLMLRYFPSVPFHYKNYNSHNKEFIMAQVLWLAGINTVEHGVNWICGEKKVENIQVSPYSIEVKPYVTLPCTNGQNILWYLLRKLNVKYSGGASQNDGWAQASWVDNEGFISNVVMYFNAIKNEFGVNTN